MKSRMNTIREVLFPYTVLFLVIMASWSVIQLPLYLELARPWMRTDGSNVGIVIRQLLMIGCESAVISAIMYCLPAYLRRLLAIFIGLLCLLTAANLAYMNYFGGIIHLLKIREFYTLFYIRDQLILQVLKPANYLQLGAGFLLVGALWFASRKARIPTPRGFMAKVFVLAPAVLAFTTLYHLQTVRFQQSVSLARQVMGNSTSYFMFGMFPVYGNMAMELMASEKSDATVDPVNDSLNAALERQETPRLDPDAVFFIQAESLDASAIRLASADGTPLMPFLRKLAGESVMLQEFYHHHNGAASASAEIGALLSIVPDAEHNGFLSIGKPNYHALNRAMERNGYESFFLHSNRGSFLGRRDAYQRMGFQHFIDMKHFTGAAAGFMARDDAFFQQALAVVAARCPPDRKPFAYLVTMQSHGPFRNYRPETLAALLAEGFVEENPPDSLRRDYLCSMRELDEALRQFWSSVTNQAYRNPLIVLYPDHQSGVLDKPANGAEKGLALIWSPALTPAIIDHPISSYDLPPTVMHLLNGENKWPESAWWIGDTVFTKGPRKIILVHNLLLEGDGTNTVYRRANEEEQKFILFSRDIQN